jgi:hypothetical protein
VLLFRKLQFEQHTAGVQPHRSDATRAAGLQLNGAERWYGTHDLFLLSTLILVNEGLGAVG